MTPLISLSHLIVACTTRYGADASRYVSVHLPRDCELTTIPVRETPGDHFAYVRLYPRTSLEIRES